MSYVAALFLPLLAAAELPERFHDASPGTSQLSGDAHSRCALGDAFFRNAEFERAEQCYREALLADPGSANAHLGIGRVARLRSQRKTAHDSFATAFSLNPADPNVLLAYSEYVSMPRVRDAICAALTGAVQPPDPRIRQVVAVLQIDRATQSRATRLAGSYSSHRLKLSPFLPVNSTSYGVVLKASLNGGKALRLVLDSGAKGIILSGKSPRDFGLEPIVDSELGGLGSGAPNSAHLTVARSLEIGDFKLENCIVEVAGKSFVSGADGIIGTNIFQEFLIRIDFWSQYMELLPFAGHQPAENASDPWLDRDAPADSRLSPLTPAYRLGHVLAVNAAVDSRANGLFVLDTGSAYNVVSPELLGGGGGISASLSWRGAQGTMAGQIAGSPVGFRLSGGPWLNDRNVISADLTAMSQNEGTKIAGLLGYSALSKSTLTLNYRDGAVQITPRGRRPVDGHEVAPAGKSRPEPKTVSSAARN